MLLALTLYLSRVRLSLFFVHFFIVLIYSSKHSASLTLDGEISGKTKIELYVTRSGSTYGGSAGTVASAKSPKTYYIN